MSENNDTRKNISNHILPTSSNLLGLCFVILSFIKLSHLSHETILDELLSVVIVFFLTASLFSYFSIRSKSRSDFYEKVADTIFLMGLVFLSAISLVIAFEIIY